MLRTKALILAMLAAALTAGFTAPAHAKGSAFDQVYADYRADGQIDACKYSPSQLKSAKDHVPPDIQQYAPDFPAALQAAIDKRAAGCAKGGSSAAATPATPGAPATPATPASGAPATAATPAATAPGATPAPASAAPPVGAPADKAVVQTAQTSSKRSGATSTPAPLVALAILVGLLALAALVWAITRWFAYEPRWLPGARHAASEAGYRAGATWAEFSDWLRLGR